MLAYLVKRVLLMLPTLLGVLTITFIVVQFVPGGPVEQLIAQTKHAGAAGGEGGSASYRAGHDLSKEQLEAIRKLYGFDKPPLQRYVSMIGHYARFDLGDSFMHNEPVWTLVREKLPVTLSLGLWTLVLSYLISIPLGVAKAVHQGTRFDFSTTLLVLLGYAVPGFVLGVALIVFFAGGTFFDWFPLRGLVSDNWHDLTWAGKIRDYLWHITLPVICLVVEQFAVVTMLTKNTFLEEIRKQYVLVARAKGVSEQRVLFKHVFRNALLPLITGLPGAVVAALFGGDLLIETLFSLDGIGLLSYESVIRRDFPVVLGLLFITTLLGLAIKLICDLLYVGVDRRVQFGTVAK